MDIEGAELDALEGARTRLRGYAPVLAICTYHKTGDLWQIPQTIKLMNDEYSLFLRVYAEDCCNSVLRRSSRGSSLESAGDPIG